MRVIGKDEVAGDPIHAINWKQGVYLVKRLLKRFDIYQLNSSSISLLFSNCLENKPNADSFTSV